MEPADKELKAPARKSLRKINDWAKGNYGPIIECVKIFQTRQVRNPGLMFSF